MAGQQRWGIRVNGQLYFSEDLTLRECREIEQKTGQSWSRIDPLRTAGHASAMLTCLIARSTTLAAAEAHVDALTMNAALDMIELVDGEDDRPDEHENGIPVVDPFVRPGAPATTG